ncbi:MAG: polymerase, sigma-24 subunit, subfamily [Candidatus Angelobacter sp.]|nr:polymerase, sigma-24 subunit, subfamily [Candidatus Angelobacter sp.]
MTNSLVAISIKTFPDRLTTSYWPGVSDRNLVEFCLKRNEDAWVEFLRRYHLLIVKVSSRTIRRWFRPTPRLLDDLFEEVLVKICANEFRALRELEWRHEGTLRGLLQVVSSTVAQDYLRRCLARSRNLHLEQQLEEFVHDRETKDSHLAVEHKILLGQLAGCLAQLIPHGPNRTRDIAMFLLYYGYRVTAAELARLYHLGTKTVESKLLRLSRLARAHCV